MKMKYTLAALAATSLAANAAVVTLDNYLTEPNGATGGAVGNFRTQTFIASTAGDGTNDDVTANSPLPATVYLQQATFLTAVAGSTPTAGQIFLNVYAGAGDGGTFLGSSTNSIDVGAITPNDPSLSMVWTFNNLALASGTTHAFYWSTTNTAGSSASTRMAVARDSGGGFGSSYSGGVATNNADGSGAVPFDARFEVKFDTVPEPSSTALLGLGGLALILRRRK